MKTVTCKDTGEVCHTYKDYLRSAHWVTLRARYYASKMPKRCYVCGDTDGPWDLHHIRYKRIGREYLRDLFLMCRSCHYSLHDEVRSDSDITLWKAHRYMRSKHRQAHPRPKKQKPPRKRKSRGRTGRRTADQATATLTEHRSTV